MAFYLGDVLVEKILNGIAESKDADETLLYTLPQLSTASINVTTETNDITDKDGNLVKRIYSGKTGEFESQNAFLNLAILGTQTGNDLIYASDDSPLVMLRTIEVNAGTKVNVKGAISGRVKVYAYDNDVVGKEYRLNTSASTTQFAVSGDELTLPTDSAVKKYFVKYYRNVTSGVRARNTADAIPGVVRLTLKVLAADICNKVKLAYVTMPNFMVSPDVTINFDKENQQLDFNGTLGIDYCSTDKELYTIDFAEDDED